MTPPGDSPIREGARQALWQGREVIAGVVVLAFGLWCASLGGWVLVPFGLSVAALGAALALTALRRLRFRGAGEAPGVVEVDEGRITYFGPTTGGSVGLSDLAELRLLRMRGRAVWRLKQGDGQALLIPAEAAGAEALFDAFASLPGMDLGAVVGALSGPDVPPGAVPPSAVVTGAVVTGAVVTDIGENRVIWRRRGQGMVRS